MYSDLFLFYRIVKDEVNIELPYHITRIEQHSIQRVTRHSKPMAEGRDNLRYVSSIIPKVKAFKDSYFFRSMNNWNLLPFELRNSWLILTSKPD